MTDYWISPFGPLSMYSTFINVGVVLSILILLILYFKTFKTFRSLLFVFAYGAVLIVGKYISAAVRVINDGALEKRENLWFDMKNLVGSHFLGHIITFMILFFPAAFLIRGICREVFGFSLASPEDTFKAGSLAALMLPVQHIFNRLGCLSRGCCYGVEYNGPLALTFPQNPEVEHPVFPCQVLEIVCMVILLVILIVLLIKGKDLIGFTVAGFSGTFFISEFFTENPYSVKHMGLTNIQIISVVLIILSVLYIINSEKMKTWFSNKMDEKEKGSLKK